MNTSRKYFRGSLIAIIIVGVIGCELFDRHQRSAPTSPDPDIPQVLNTTYGNGCSCHGDTPGVFQTTGVFVKHG